VKGLASLGAILDTKRGINLDPKLNAALPNIAAIFF